MAAQLLSFVSRLTLFVALGVAAGPLGAQSVAFKRVPLPEATTLGHISAITQDRHGFMWLATHTGLYRYDGYRWTSYWNQSPTPGYLIGNRSECVYADPEGYIWVGAYASGLHRFDPVTGSFTKIKLDVRDSSARHHTFVTALTPDRRGNLWVGTHEGLYRLHRQTGRVTHYRHDPRNPRSLSNDRVWVIYEDRRGTLWVGTGTPWERPREAGGLNRFDPQTGTFTRYLHDPLDPNSLAANPVRALLEDSRGTFWVGTFGDGLHAMDREKGTFRRYPSDTTRPSVLSRPFPADGDFTRDGVSFVHEDPSGALWIGAYNAGLVRYEPATAKVTRYNPDPSHPDALGEKGPWAVYTSREGVLWIATFGGGGLYRVDPFQKTIPHYPTGARVNAFFQEPSGVHWLGTTHGLLRRDPRTGRGQRYGHDPRNPRSLANDTVTALCEDRQGSLWVATRGGLHRFDRRTGTFTRYRHDPAKPAGLADDLIYSLYPDWQGYLWMSLPEGLDRLDPRTGQFTHYRLPPAGSVKSVIDRPMVEDAQGNLWVSGYGGVCRLDPRTGRVQRYLADGNFPSMYRDHRGEVWLGAIQGVFRQGRTAGDFKRFRDPVTGVWIPPVVSITEDLDSALWLSTGTGLLSLDKDRRTLRAYGSAYGVNGRGIVTKKAYRGPAGELFFGTEQGYYVVAPRQLGRDHQPPQVVLTDFRLGDHSVKPGPDSPLPAPLPQAAAITLPYDQNTFTFDFAGMHYGNPEQNQHLFRLDGYDEEWRRAGNEKSASYYNVLPGKYTFRVKAASSDKAWAEKKITVVVRPPWWKTYWAYLGYGVLAAGLTGFAYRSVIRRERLQADLKIRQVEADKLRELDQAKSRFFSNISHELRTPLTLIQGSAAILREGEKKETPARKGHYELLERNTVRLLQLIGQLLDLSRLEAGKLALQPRPGDLMHFLRAVVYAFASLAERQRVEYRVSIPAGSWWAHFDADKLEKIANNLLSNACKFTPAGGTIWVEVTLEWVPDPPVCRCVLRVADTGIGISAAQLPRVFERIYQPHYAATRTSEGSGGG
ncbi:MAG: SMP-30/gluconolactonase/LRE family protein, partial [Cytophagales bacterium]|nr:SMP-30/gluconolactonase/LRE family protein [Cytophagales bacterium]